MIQSRGLETGLPEAKRDATQLRLVSYSPDLHQQRHAHDYASVTLILGGGVEESAGRSTRHARQGWIGLKAPGVDHACQFAGDTTRTLQLRLPGKYFTINMRARHSLPAWQWRPPGHLVSEMLDLLRLQHAPPALGRAAEVEGRVLDMLASFFEATDSAASSAPSWLPRMCEALLEGDAPIADLARDCGVHRVYLARSFRRHVGLPPARYRSVMRILRVINSVQTDPTALAALAAAEGFSDQSHMIRSVRAATGLTPLAWRRLAH